MQLQDLFQLQPQDYPQLFQDLFIQCYQFTINNPVNAGILAVSVWLLTAIFYSIRITLLNGRLKALTKAAQDNLTALNASQQQVQQLEADVSDAQQQLSQAQQHNLSLQERLSELGGQIADSIVSLAAQPELGQQGLTVSPGLQPEQLWQRFSAATKHLGENLLAEQKNSQEFQQAVSAETAKLAEKNLQMQALQFRFDNQKQQLAKLEASIEEQQNQLSQQQEASQQQIVKLEAKIQDEINRYLDLEKRFQQSAAQRPIAAAVAPLVTEVSAPLEVAVAEETPLVSGEPAIVDISIPAVNAVSPEPEKAEAVVAEKIEPVAPPVAAKASATGLGGKFKSMFGSAKAKNTLVETPIAAVEPVAPLAEPVVEAVIEVPQSVLVTPVAVEPPLVVTSVPQTPSKPASNSNSVGGMFANMRQKIQKIDEMFGMVPAQSAPEAVEQAETVVETHHPEPIQENIATEVVVEQAAKSTSFKIPFGFGKKPAAEAQPVEQAPEVEVVVEPVVETVTETPAPAKTAGGQLKGLLGKFKRG